MNKAGKHEICYVYAAVQRRLTDQYA